MTSANAAAPSIVALVNVPLGGPPTVIAPPSGSVFHSDGSQWVCDLSTQGLAAGTTVVQIRFWDGRILEAAFVLR